MENKTLRVDNVRIFPLWGGVSKRKKVIVQPSLISRVALAQFHLIRLADLNKIAISNSNSQQVFIGNQLPLPQERGEVALTCTFQ